MLARTMLLAVIVLAAAGCARNRQSVLKPCGVIEDNLRDVEARRARINSASTRILNEASALPAGSADKWRRLHESAVVVSSQRSMRIFVLTLVMLLVGGTTVYSTIISG